VPFRAEKFIPDRQKILAEENRGGIEAHHREIPLISEGFATESQRLREK
jgi:hypothetical protein